MVLAPHERTWSVVYADHPHIEISTIFHFPADLTVRLALLDGFALVESLLAANHGHGDLN